MWSIGCLVLCLILGKTIEEDNKMHPYNENSFWSPEKLRNLRKFRPKIERTEITTKLGKKREIVLEISP